MKRRPYKILTSVTLSVTGFKADRDGQRSPEMIWVNDFDAMGGVVSPGEYTLYLNLMAVKKGLFRGRPRKPQLILAMPLMSGIAYPKYKKDMKKVRS